MYKLTKGSLSKIRASKEDADALIEEGYTLDGEVDKNYNVIKKREKKKVVGEEGE